MQVGTLAIQHLFEKDVLYSVPLYQRPYVWNEDEQWQPLWDDLRRLSEAFLDGKPARAHFLGASVQDRPVVPPGHIETRLLIDGQQRLTTIQIILKAFEDVVRQSGDERYLRAIEKLTYNNHPLSTEPHERYKVWPTNADRADFETVMETQAIRDLQKAYGVRSSAKTVGRNIPDAYLFFHSVVEDWLNDEESGPRDDKIRALYSTIRDNVRMVVIDLDEKDDAQLIFETLNARGTPLLAADLVKNSLLSELQAGGGNAERAYTKHWQHFDLDSGFWRTEVGRGHARRARIELFLQYALTLITREDVAAAHLYTAYRDFATGESGLTPMDRIRAFERYGRIFKDLQEDHQNPRVQLFLERLRTMDITTAYPFLLKLFEVMGDQEDRLVEVLVDLESYLVRRMVCRLSTRGYNRLFVDLVQSLETESENMASMVRFVLGKGTAEYDRWPGEDEFRKAWLHNPLYENLTRPRLRMILEALEQGLRNEYAETHAVPKNLTVEHILPQAWEMNWPVPEGENEVEATLRRNQILHTIGNLTLLSKKLNPAQSNKAWLGSQNANGGKREALREHSVLFLNKKLVSQEVWDEQAIQARASDLYAVAASIWPPAQR